MRGTQCHLVDFRAVVEEYERNAFAVYRSHVLPPRHANVARCMTGQVSAGGEGTLMGQTTHCGRLDPKPHTLPTAKFGDTLLVSVDAS